MQIQLKFFASLREAVGIGAESVVLPPEIKTAGEVRVFLCSRGGVWAEALAEGKALRIACNQQMAASDTPISEGYELAFFPPVTGG